MLAENNKKTTAIVLQDWMRLLHLTILPLTLLCAKSLLHAPAHTPTHTHLQMKAVNYCSPFL